MSTNSSTTAEIILEQVSQDPTTVIVLASIVFISEIMGVLPIKQNGILHSIVTLFMKLLNK